MNTRIAASLPLLLLLISPLSGSAEAPVPMSSGFISAEDLHARLSGKNGDHATLLIEVGWGGPEEYYDKGHIPGAIHVNTDEIEYDQFESRATTEPKELGRGTTPEEDLAKGLTPEDTLPRNWWNIYPDKYLLPALANMGVDLNSTVILYGSDPTGSARLAWTMLYAGVRDVRLLNGGLDAWRKAGFDVTKEPTPRRPKMNFGAEEAVHPEYLVDIGFVRKAITDNDPDFILADIRTRDEFDGKTAPYSYIPTKGRVKNARWGKAGEGPWTMDFYLNDDGTFKNPQEIELMWAENGITRDKHVAFYCGTGWRSSLAFFYAYQMGWPRISIFDSSWYEWSMGPEAGKNPIE